MPVIEVKKPFGLRISSKAEKRDFSVGRHTVSEEELGHWFMQACLSPEDGRAELVTDADESEDGSPRPADLTKEQLMKLKNSELEAMLAACGAPQAPGFTKAELVALILAGREGVDLTKGVTVIKGDDGFYVREEE